MDIIIKSFNRPYYLDRCLQSIQTFVQDSKYTIIVLDDGTSQKYLDKIKLKYPEIVVLKSEFYTTKSQAIENNSDRIDTRIPIKLWTESVKKSSEYFLLLEDDMWFTEKINLNELYVLSKENNIQMLKLYWLGNPKLISKTNLKKNHLISIYRPNLYIKNPFLYQFFFKIYRFKTRKIFSFFNIYSDEKALNYYTIYATAGVIFNKIYFLKLWKNHTNSVDEGLQLLNALKFINKNLKSNFAHTNQEYLKTGFVSSATNKDYKNAKINMFEFNKILNEKWFNNEFVSTTSFSTDLIYKDIENILETENNPTSNKLEWQKWVASFRNQYINFGCNID